MGELLTKKIQWKVGDAIVESMELAASSTSEWISLGHHEGCAVNVLWLGADTPTGELKLQGSNGTAPIDIPRSQVDIYEAGSGVWNAPELEVEKIRVVFTSVSGGSGDYFEGKVTLK